MVFARIRNQSRKVDPFDRLSADVRRDLGGGAMTQERFREEYMNQVPDPEPKWTPPNGARTFADYSHAEAVHAVAQRPHVVIREDPMFGRHGYAKEVIADAKHGFLVLVVAYAVKRRVSDPWQEPFKPRDVERAYWPPSKVEFAIR